jgi:hypothetical protein
MFVNTLIYHEFYIIQNHEIYKSEKMQIMMKLKCSSIVSIFGPME